MAICASTRRSVMWDCSFCSSSCISILTIIKTVFNFLYWIFVGKYHRNANTYALGICFDRTQYNFATYCTKIEADLSTWVFLFYLLLRFRLFVFEKIWNLFFLTENPVETFIYMRTIVPESVIFILHTCCSVILRTFIVKNSLPSIVRGLYSQL